MIVGHSCGEVGCARMAISFNWNSAVTSSERERSGMWCGRQTGVIFLGNERKDGRKETFLSFLLSVSRGRGAGGVTGMKLGYKRNLHIVWLSPAFYYTDCLKSLSRSPTKRISPSRSKKGAGSQRNRGQGECDPSAWFLMLVLTQFLWAASKMNKRSCRSVSSGKLSSTYKCM